MGLPGVAGIPVWWAQPPHMLHCATASGLDTAVHRRITRQSTAVLPAQPPQRLRYPSFSPVRMLLCALGFGPDGCCRPVPPKCGCVSKMKHPKWFSTQK